MHPGRAGAAAALLAALLVGGGCGDGGGARTAGDAAARRDTTMSDAAFDKLELDTFEASAGTPKVGDDFEGIEIAMPAKVPVGKLGRIPLCGVWAFDNATLAKFPIVEDHLVFLARNVQTHETATGHFRVHEDPAGGEDLKPGADEPPPAPNTTGEPVIGDEDITTRGWFNFDLGRVWKVPAKPGRWRVHVALHDVQSNEVEFEVVK